MFIENFKGKAWDTRISCLNHAVIINTCMQQRAISDSQGLKKVTHVPISWKIVPKNILEAIQKKKSKLELKNMYK